MPEDFSGRAALVTGASGGIGAAIALAIAKCGSAVALQYRQSKPRETLAKVEATGRRGVAICADFSAIGFEMDLIARASAALGPIDILINCAADQRMDSDAPFDDILATNTRAVAALSQKFAGQAKKGAVIVNISSIEAQHPAPNHLGYGASKAALEALTRGMATEFGPRGIRVNAVAPGLIDRPGLAGDWPEGIKRWNAACPLARTGTPQDVAQAVLFLASNAASWITGATLSVDGGTSAGPGW